MVVVVVVPRRACGVANTVTLRNLLLTDGVKARTVAEATSAIMGCAPHVIDQVCVYVFVIVETVCVSISHSTFFLLHLEQTLLRGLKMGMELGSRVVQMGAVGMSIGAMETGVRIGGTVIGINQLNYGAVSPVEMIGEERWWRRRRIRFAR